MMQVIDDDYVAALLDLPDGRERVTRWIFSLLNERDDAQVITKACVEKLKGSVDFLEVQDTSEESTQLLEWLRFRGDLDLSYQYDIESIPHHLLKPGLIPTAGWCVHKQSGGVNDREWTMVSLEPTPLEALRSAHKAFCDGR